MNLEQTENYDRYKEFLDIYNNFCCKTRGINLTKLAGFDLIDFIVFKKQVRLREIAGAIFKKLDSTELINSLKSSNATFSFDAPKRKDHRKLMEMIQESVDDSSLVIINYKRNFVFLFFSFIYFLSIILRHTKKNNISLLQKIYLALRFTSYKQTIINLNKKLKGQNLENKAYIPFNSSAYTESVITAVLKQKGMKTFHVFHGILCNYQRFITNDILAGINIQAEYKLPFGEMGKEILISDFKLSKEKIFVAGNPKYPYTKIDVCNNFKSCLVLGGIALYDNDFKELFPIIDKVATIKGLKFDLKPHPLSNISKTDISAKYKNINILPLDQTVQELLSSKKYDFAITYNTFSYYECMYYGVVPLRWGKNENLDYNGFDDKFNNLDSLLVLIEKYTNMNKNVLEKNIEDLLINVLGMGINNYNKVIKSDLTT